MNKRSAIAISIASVIFLISVACNNFVVITPVLAQESTSTATVRPITTTVRSLQQKIETRKIALDTRLATKEANLQDRIAKERQLMGQRKLMEASKAAIFRGKLEERKALIASEEAKFKVKLQIFKDKQKANIATRVNTNLNKINQNQTGQMLKNLDLMSNLLDKLTDRVNQGTPDIKDPAAANQAIADARQAVDTARTAVQVQAQKGYTIAVTTETKIRLDAQTKRDQLFKDIMATRTLVIDARQKTADAVSITKSGTKTATPSSQVKEGSASGQQ